MGVVMVTGAAGGFGLPAALAFARDGHAVYAGMDDVRKGASLERMAAGEGLNVRVMELDVASERSVRSVVDLVLDEEQRLDVLAHCDRAELQGAVHLVGDDEARWQLESTVVGLLRLVREVTPVMRRQGGGSIVVLGSIAGLVTPPYWGMYAAAMHAMESLAEAMHYELSQVGIRVSIVEPGQFATLDGGQLRTAARQTPDTVEHERARRFDEASLRLTVSGRPADADHVARTMVTAATGTARRFRYVVGADAALVAALRERYEFEDFEQVMRQTLDWWD